MPVSKLESQPDRPDAAADDPGRPRAHTHAMWASVAPSWAQHAEFVDARHAAVTDRMLDLARLAPGDRVLELACGAGGVGIAAAPRVLPVGDVVLSDVADAMTATAVRRASALGITNVSARRLDLEDIDEPDSSFDAVLCRDGLQFASDPGAAIREIRRVLHPEGRVVLAVWGPRERNPWLDVVFATVSAQLGAPMPPPGVPGPFSLDDPARLADLLADDGLADVRVDELPVPLRVASFEDWWALTTSLAGPLALILSSLPAEAAAALRERARDAVEPYRHRDGVELPGVALVASARRPTPPGA